MWIFGFSPNTSAQVREIARNAKVQATHASMEYPPNSGNGASGLVAPGWRNGYGVTVLLIGCWGQVRCIREAWLYIYIHITL